MSKYVKKYKCPHCEGRYARPDLASHIDREHDDMIPQGQTPLQVAFDSVNKKTEPHGTCMMCGADTKWNENKGRYDSLCGSKKCHDDYVKMVDARLKKAKGVTKQEMLSNPEFQNKMLKGRSISGTYTFSDGGKVDYVGSFEKNFLEFLDKVLNVQSIDIQAPGPTIKYMYEGKEHFWITDYMYIPYNLVFDIKDGGSNPNNREMKSYREKQIAKEKAIEKQGKYNYCRLTNNDFSQLFSIMMELKESLVELDVPGNIKDIKPIIRINESTEIIQESAQVDNTQSIFDELVHFIKWARMDDSRYCCIDELKSPRTIDGKCIYAKVNGLSNNSLNAVLDIINQNCDINSYYTIVNGDQYLCFDAKTNGMISEASEMPPEHIDTFYTELKKSLAESAINGFTMKKTSKGYKYVDEKGKTASKLNYYDYKIKGFDYVLIANVETELEYRRKGLAGSLVAAAYEDLVSKDKHDGVYLFVKQDNEPAIRMYTGLGFRKIRQYDLKSGKYFIMAKGKINKSKFDTMNFGESAIDQHTVLQLDPVSEMCNDIVDLINEEAEYSSKNKYPVYILLMHSGSTLANIIQNVTHDTFSHACIAFNAALDPFYSFGNKVFKKFGNGLTIQNTQNEFWKHLKAYYNVYVMYVTKEQLDKMKKRLDWFVEHEKKLRYGLVDLIAVAMKIPTEFRKKWFCSRFVMEILGQGIPLEKVPSLWKPQDIASLKNISLVNSGMGLLHYNPEITEKNEKLIKQGKGDQVQVEDISVNETYANLFDSDDIIEKEYGVIDIDGLYNSIVELKGKSGIKYRGRSEVLIVKDDSIFLAGDIDTKYYIPGGGWDENESHEKAAVREAQEEALITCKNVLYAGHYVSELDDAPDWVKKKIPDKSNWWKGKYTELYVADYDSKYTGYVHPLDKDNSIANGKFYKISDVFDRLSPEHQTALLFAGKC